MSLHLNTFILLKDVCLRETWERERKRDMGEGYRRGTWEERERGWGRGRGREREMYMGEVYGKGIWER